LFLKRLGVGIAAVFAKQGISIRGEDSARPALGTGEAVSVRVLLTGGLRGQVIRVHNIFGLEFAIQNGKGTARLGMSRIICENRFEEIPFFFGIVGGLAKDVIGFDFRLVIVREEQGLLGVMPRQGAVTGFQVDPGFTDEIVVAFHF
jgi:hypothetical protein